MNLMYKLVELGERFNRPVPDATVIRRQAQAVKDAVKVRIQPVADYLYMETDQEKFHAVRDFPDLTPLWPLTCYMWAMPRFFRSEGQILPNPPGVERVEHVCLAAAKSYDKPPVKWVYNFLLWAWHPGFPNMIRQIVMVIGLAARAASATWSPGHAPASFTTRAAALTAGLASRRTRSRPNSRKDIPCSTRFFSRLHCATGKARESSACRRRQSSCSGRSNGTVGHRTAGTTS